MELSDIITQLSHKLHLDFCLLYAGFCADHQKDANGASHGNYGDNYFPARQPCQHGCQVTLGCNSWVVAEGSWCIFKTGVYTGTVSAPAPNIYGGPKFCECP